VSIEQQIETLERLAAADAEMKQLAEGLEKERGVLETLRSELDELAARLATDGDSIAEMEKTRNDLIQELRQVGQQIDRSREKMQRARNEREVNMCERELDELRKIQRDRDDEIKKIGELSDLARESTRVAEARKSELTAILAGSLEGATKSITDLSARLEAVTAERAAITKGLPGLLARRYDRLLSRNKVPIAMTHDGTCLGCFVKLPPMMFHQMLSRISFEECPTCHRIIYYTPPPTEEQRAAKAAAAAEAAASDEQASSDATDAQASGEASS
jgi:hypothetical protein